MRKFLTIAAISLLATGAMAAGEIYRWKDANGTWHFSDQPQPGAELVKGSRRPDPPPAPPPSVPLTLPQQLNTTTSAPPLSPEAAAQVRADVAAAKSEQCKKAEENYRQLIQARRVFTTDQKGNRSYLNDAQAEAARMEARSVRDQTCGGR